MQGVSGAKRYVFHFAADELVMAEMVRFRALQQGKIELHILDYHDEGRRWVSWTGYARVNKGNLVNADRLKALVLHQHNLRTLSPMHGPGRCEAEAAPVDGKLQNLSKHKPEVPGPWKIPVTPRGLYQCRCVPWS
jgi:hypothetical protein